MTIEDILVYIVIALCHTIAGWLLGYSMCWKDNLKKKVKKQESKLCQ